MIRRHSSTVVIPGYIALPELPRPPEGGSSRSHTASWSAACSARLQQTSPGPKTALKSHVVNRPLRPKEVEASVQEWQSFHRGVDRGDIPRKPRGRGARSELIQERAVCIDSNDQVRDSIAPVRSSVSPARIRCPGCEGGAQQGACRKRERYRRFVPAPASGGRRGGQRRLRAYIRRSGPPARSPSGPGCVTLPAG